MRPSLFAPALLAILLTAPLTAQGLNVGVLGADLPGAIADVEATLLADARIQTTTAIDVEFSTPSLATLNQYDVVIAWTRQPSHYLDPAGLGDQLAAYVSGGGGVVECMGSGISADALLGAWAGLYNCTNPNSFLPFTGTYGLGTIIAPTHPVMAGVTTFSSAPNSYYAASPPVAWATSLADYTTGSMLVAENNNSAQVIYLNFFPVSSNFGTPGWDAFTDGDLLITNAVAYVGPAPPSGPMIALQGTCGAPGSSVDLTGATPNGRIALAYGFGTGSAIVAGGPACVGIVTGLDVITLGEIAFADSNGDYSFTGVGGGIPAAACGVVTVQVADASTCVLTNTLAL